MPFFRSRDGLHLHYELAGSGPPLILHLGAGGDLDLWRAAGYVEPLARNFQCVLFDHRGHGKSDHPTEVEANLLDRYADDVVDLIDELGLPTAAFFGWSNAIAVGLRAADAHPEKFDALVLFGAMAPSADAAQIQAATERRLVALREKGWWCILEPMLEAEKSPVPQWFLDRVVATDLEPLIAYTAGRPSWNWNAWDALPRIKAPCLVLAGELEDPDDVMQKVASAMPDARRVRIPDREHINAFLYSEFAAPLVTQFLTERRTARAVS